MQMRQNIQKPRVVYSSTYNLLSTDLNETNFFISFHDDENA